MRPAVRVLGRVGGYWWGSGATCWAEGTAPPPAVPKSPLPGEGHTKGGHKGLCPLPCSLPRAGHGARRAGGGPRRWHWDGVSHPPPQHPVSPEGARPGAGSRWHPATSREGLGGVWGNRGEGSQPQNSGLRQGEQGWGRATCRTLAQRWAVVPVPVPPPQNVTSGDPKSHGR